MAVAERIIPSVRTGQERSKWAVLIKRLAASEQPSMDWSIIQRLTIASTCVLFAGCTVCENAHRTMIGEPSLFSNKHDRKRSIAVYRRWADEAWREEVASDAELVGRSDFGVGFRDGFVDYTYAGGNGEPPPVPPRRLWNVMFRAAEGRERSQEWFAGYRRGAQASREGGFRSMATIQSSLFGYPDAGGVHLAPGPMGPSMGMEPEAIWNEGEMLPAPDAAPLPPPEAPATNGLPPGPRNVSPATESPAVPSDEPQNQGRDRTPATDPPSRPDPVREQLPPEEPLDLDLPAMDESTIDLRELGNGTAEPAAADREPAAGNAPVQQANPTAIEKGPTPESATGRQSTTDSSGSSVRFSGLPSATGGTVRLQVASQSRSPTRTPQARQLQDKWTTAVSPGVRLTSGSSSDLSPKASQESTTIEIHAGGNPLRNSVSTVPSRRSLRMER
jgi:hypothetical protein